MGKLNEIQEQTTQSWGDNSFTTSIKVDTVEFDSAKDSFTFNDPVEVPGLKINGTEIATFDAEDKAKLDSLTTTMQVKGRIDDISDLPVDASVGDVYLVGLSGDGNFEEYVCVEVSGSPATPVWENLGHVKTQSDWNQSNNSSDNYIKNKPAIKAGQGVNSIIEGSGTTASGENSHAEGYQTQTTMNASHAEGQLTTASGQQSHAEGSGTTASSASSHAEGTSTTASGSSSHAEGFGTSASGQDSHAEGYNTTANHRSQHVFGEYNVLDPSTAGASDRGNYVEIVGNGAYAHNSNARTLDWSGNETLAGNLTIGGTITANGQEITPSEPQVQADWNQNNVASKDYIKNRICYKGPELSLSPEIIINSGGQTPGWPNFYFNLSEPIDVSKTYKFNIGEDITIVLDMSGQTNESGSINGGLQEGSYSFNWNVVGLAGAPQGETASIAVLGNPTIYAGKSVSVTTGTLVQLDVKYIPFAINKGTGSNSIVLSIGNASGIGSIAHGGDTTASGNTSFAQGNHTTASGDFSVATGVSVTASGYTSFAQGVGAGASGDISFAQGDHTTANQKAQLTFGAYNIPDPSTAAPTERGNYIEIVGNGTDYGAKSNARTLDWSGNENIAGMLRIGSSASTGGCLFKVDGTSLKISFDDGTTWLAVSAS